MDSVIRKVKVLMSKLIQLFKNMISNYLQGYVSMILEMLWY